MPLIDWVSDLIARDLMWQERPIGNTMSKSLFGLRITASMLLWTVASVSAQQLGTAEQARAMLDRAISALKSNEATALSEFNDPNDKQFHDRDLYIFCYNISDGKITAYESPALLNIDVRTLTLKDDPIGQRVYEAVQSAPEGSIVTIEYKRNPARPNRFQNKLSRPHWASKLRGHILQIDMGRSPVAKEASPEKDVSPVVATAKATLKKSSITSLK